jgi:hypothetical protein
VLASGFLVISAKRGVEGVPTLYPVTWKCFSIHGDFIKKDHAIFCTREMKTPDQKSLRLNFQTINIGNKANMYSDIKKTSISNLWVKLGDKNYNSN